MYIIVLAIICFYWKCFIH